MPLFGPFASRAYLAGVARGDLVPVFDDAEPAAALAAFRRGDARNAFRFAPGSPYGAGFPAGAGAGPGYPAGGPASRDGAGSSGGSDGFPGPGFPAGGPGGIGGAGSGGDTSGGFDPNNPPMYGLGGPNPFGPGAKSATGAPPSAPTPTFPLLGAPTTRRTQLFGPLAALSALR